MQYLGHQWCCCGEMSESGHLKTIKDDLRPYPHNSTIFQRKHRIQSIVGAVAGLFPREVFEKKSVHSLTCYRMLRRTFNRCRQAPVIFADVVQSGKMVIALRIFNTVEDDCIYESAAFSVGWSEKEHDRLENSKRTCLVLSIYQAVFRFRLPSGCFCAINLTY